MSDIIDTSFLAPYPAADVYGIGVAGAPVPEAAPAAPPARTEPPNGGAAPSSEPAGEQPEGLGRYVDVRV